MSEFTYNPPVVSAEGTRALTMGERIAFGMGAPTQGYTVVLTEYGYRARDDD